MQFDRTLLLVALILIVGGLASVITAIPPDLNLDFDNLGDPQTEELKKLCVLYEDAKQELVRLNLSMHDTISGFRRAFGGHTIAIGIVALVLKGIREPATQKKVLKAFLIATFIALSISVHFALTLKPDVRKWSPMVFQVIVIGLLTASLFRLRKEAA